MAVLALGVALALGVVPGLVGTSCGEAAVAAPEAGPARGGVGVGPGQAGVPCDPEA